MDAVIDASIAVLLLLDPQREQIGSRLAAFDELHAPQHFDVEVVAGLRRCWLRGEISREDFTRLACLIAQAPVQRVTTLPLIPRMVALAENVTPHDASYAALAEALGATLITADRRLAAAPGLTCPIIQLG